MIRRFGELRPSPLSLFQQETLSADPEEAWEQLKVFADGFHFCAVTSALEAELEAPHDHAYSASRGYPNEVDVAELLPIDQTDLDLFKKWCSIVGIPYQEPKWLLCSMWG